MYRSKDYRDRAASNKASGVPPAWPPSGWPKRGFGKLVGAGSLAAPIAVGGASGPASIGPAPRTLAAYSSDAPGTGNPNGHAYVPPAGRAVNTGHPNHVIGTGTPASCTSAAVVNAVAKGGIITFNCGPKPVTITMTATAKVVNTSHKVVLDGGGKVTLSGGGKIRILYMNTCDRNQKYITTTAGSSGGRSSSCRT